MCCGNNGWGNCLWIIVLIIILLCKPFAITLYSLGLTLVWNALV